MSHIRIARFIAIGTIIALLSTLLIHVIQTRLPGRDNQERTRYVQDSLVSIFENSTTEIQYGFIKDIGDGNGFTAGRAGFTSKTGDMLEVLIEYAKLKPDSPMVQYIESLTKVLNTAATAALSRLETDWALAAQTDARFREAQDIVNERLYRTPANDMAHSIGVRLPLTIAAIYEAGIQHGYGDNYDSLTKIIERTNQAAGGTPKSGVDELKWLNLFIATREDDLLHPENQDYAPIFLDSVDRAHAIRKIYDEQNYDLTQPITITVYGDTFTF